MTNESFNGFLFADPKYFDVTYKINPYMQKNSTDTEKSWKQWSDIVKSFRKYNENIVTVDYDTYNTQRSNIDSLPDSVFCANHALPIPDDGFLLSNMKNSQRKDEIPYFKKWAEYNGYKVRSMPDNVAFEGAGDGKWHPKKQILWMGFGSRTDEEAVNIVGNVVDQEVIKLQLVSDYYYHLDVCFEPLNRDEVLIIPDAFSEESLHKIRSHFDSVIEVHEKDKKTMGGNCCLIQDNLVAIDRSNNSTIQKLKSNGYDIVEVNTSEFMKSGGSVDCLCLRIP